MASPHYVGIDATDPVDTLAWGAKWRELFPSWKNLVEPILPAATAPGKPRQRLDAGKPLVMELTSDPTYTRRFRDACVLPLGAAPLREPGTLLDKGAMAAGCEFTRALILSPGVDSTGLSALGNGTMAELVLLSGHFRAGHFYGKDRANAERVLFHLEDTADAGLKFVGPRWLLLSTCSACQAAYSSAWAALMTGDSSLRGILGFRTQFPPAFESVEILERLVRALANGSTFVAAWSAINAKVPFNKSWVAICRAEAAGDRVADLQGDGLKDLPDSRVLRFDATDRKGADIGPFRILRSAYWIKKTRIKWDERNQPENQLREGDAVEIAVFPPAKTYKPSDTIAITVVCRRIDYPQRYDIRTMFELKGAVGAPIKEIRTEKRLTAPRRPPLPPAEAGRDDGHDTWVINVGDQEVDRVKLFLRCRKRTPARPEDGLGVFKDTEVLLWLRVQTTLYGKEKPTTDNFERDGAIVASKV